MRLLLRMWCRYAARSVFSAFRHGNANVGIFYTSENAQDYIKRFQIVNILARHVLAGCSPAFGQKQREKQP